MTTPTPEPNSTEQPAAGKPSSDSTQPPAENPPTTEQPKEGAKPTEEKPLGPNGEKALQSEREAKKALEQQLRSLGLGDLIGVDVSALKTLAQALGGKPSGDAKSDLEKLTERLSKQEEDLAAERQARLRAEVANTKGLTLEQTAELKGSTAEELAAHADRLKTLFAPADGNGQQPTPGTPRPDLSQGMRGTGSDIDARIADAESKGDVKAAIALKNQKLLTSTNQ